MSFTDAFLVWLELSAFSVWVRESPSIFAFPMILAVHTIGLGLIAGINAALDLRVLGVAPRIPVVEFRRFLPVMWLGLWLNVASGIVLLIAYPTKALTNPVFYLKLTLIAAALAILKIVRRSVLVDGPARRAVEAGGAEGVRHRVTRVLGRRHHGGPPARLHLHSPDGVGLTYLRIVIQSHDLGSAVRVSGYRAAGRWEGASAPGLTQRRWGAEIAASIYSNDRSTRRPPQSMRR